MARIVPSELAPEDEARYSLGQSEFTLAPGGVHETEDRTLISDAIVHPWLDVEFDEVEEYGSAIRPGSISPEDDVLSFQNSVAFDPEEIRKVEEAKVEAVEDRTAIDAGLDQGEVHEVGDAATTLAADEADDNDEGDHF